MDNNRLGSIRSMELPWAPQLIRFAVVGAGGYLVNLAVYWVCLDSGLQYRVAATVAFLVALTNNFVWNRLWTFREANGTMGGQAARFIVVSTAAFFLSLGLLAIFVRDFGMSKLVGQALAIVLVTPVGFVGNKLWSFGSSLSPRSS